MVDINKENNNQEEKCSSVSIASFTQDQSVEVSIFLILLFKNKLYISDCKLKLLLTKN